MAEVDAKKDLETEKIAIAVIGTKMDYLKESIEKVDKKIDVISGQFVPQTEFRPVKNIVYGLVALMLVAVIGAIMSLVFRR